MFLLYYFHRYTYSVFNHTELVFISLRREITLTCALQCKEYRHMLVAKTGRKKVFKTRKSIVNHFIICYRHHYMHVLLKKYFLKISWNSEAFDSESQENSEVIIPIVTNNTYAKGQYIPLCSYSSSLNPSNKIKHIQYCLACISNIVWYLIIIVYVSNIQFR